jgi:hypothetical protein
MDFGRPFIKPSLVRGLPAEKLIVIHTEGPPEPVPYRQGREVLVSIARTWSRLCSR